MDDPASAAYPPVRRGPSPRRAGGLLLIAAIAFLIGLAVMAYLTRHYASWFGTTVTTTRQTVQPAGAAAGGAGFSPQAPLSASGAQTADLEAIDSRALALNGRIAELEARLASTGVAAQAASGNANRAEGLLVAFAARRALDRGLGLGYLEGQLRDRFGPVQPQATATVIGAARQPVTLEDLREGIEAISPQLQTGNTTDGWWASLRREVSDLVVIRRDGAPSPRPADRLVRAQRMLDGGQVEGALAEVARLPGAEAGDRWIAAAKRYIDARRALDTLETAAIMGQGRDPYVPVVAAPAASVPPAAADPVTAPAAR